LSYQDRSVNISIGYTGRKAVCTVPYVLVKYLSEHIKYSTGRNLCAVNLQQGRVLFAESDNRLVGGNSNNGGLSNVNWNHASNHNDNIGFRPLRAFLTAKQQGSESVGCVVLTV